MQQVKPVISAAPSRWSYRLQRLMLTPLFRLMLRFVVPFVIVFAAVSAWFADEERRDRVALWVADIRASIETRPEFMVKLLGNRNRRFRCLSPLGPGRSRPDARGLLTRFIPVLD